MLAKPLSAGATAAALLLAGAPAFAASTLIGDTISFMRAYPNTTTQFGLSIPDTTVAAGTADQVTWNGLATNPQLLTVIDPEADRISFVFPAGFGVGGTATLFDGFVLSGFDTDIASVSVLSNTTNMVVTLSNTARSVFVNLNGNPGGGASPRGFVIGVNLVGAIPEPAPAALLAAGTAVVGILARRRKRS